MEVGALYRQSVQSTQYNAEIVLFLLDRIARDELLELGVVAERVEVGFVGNQVAIVGVQVERAGEVAEGQRAVHGDTSVGRR